jgi:hypothetical protein
MKACPLAALIVVSLVVAARTAAAQAAPANPVSVVKGFYDAVNAKQLDKALTYVADNAVFSWPGIGIFSGRGKVRELFQTAARGWTFKGSNFRDNGGRVTYAYEISENGKLIFASPDGVTVVKNGKIILDGTEATVPR